MTSNRPFTHDTPAAPGRSRTRFAFKPQGHFTRDQIAKPTDLKPDPTKTVSVAMQPSKGDPVAVERCFLTTDELRTLAATLREPMSRRTAAWTKVTDKDQTDAAGDRPDEATTRFELPDDVSVGSLRATVARMADGNKPAVVCLGFDSHPLEAYTLEEADELGRALGQKLGDA